MKRDIGLYVDDIKDSINNILLFIKGIDKAKFLSDRLRQSAVARELEIIGEAAKNVPDSFREKYPSIPWNDIAGFRDVLSHAYFRVDLEMVWKIVEQDLPVLKKEIGKIKI